MPKSYSLYGLSLHASHDIPGLFESSFKGETDVKVWLDSMPPWLRENGTPERTLRYSSRYNAESHIIDMQAAPPLQRCGFA